MELHQTAMQNFNTSFDAGPLESNPALSAKNAAAERLKLAYASSNPVSSLFSSIVRTRISMFYKQKLSHFDIQ